VGARLYFGVRRFEGQGAWESSHAGVPKPRNAKGVLFTPWVIARGHQIKRDLWIRSKGSSRSPKSHFGSEEDHDPETGRSVDPAEVGGLHQFSMEDCTMLLPYF
jgi:hypothetical protein